MLHFYLQQPGIIKMFLLCNIPGKVPLFFLYKQDIMRVNCMQNITKYYTLLRNVASVLKFFFFFLPFVLFSVLVYYSEFDDIFVVVLFLA
jgi:hypothetical protein